jgi:hypothetical protein
MFVPNDVVTAAVISENVKSFLKRYRKALLVLRKNQPKEWDTLLNNAKSKAHQSADAQDVVEMISLCQIEYECSMEDGLISPLVKSLNEFIKANHIEMGE